MSMKPLSDRLLELDILTLEVDPFEQPDLYLQIMTAQKAAVPMSYDRWKDEYDKEANKK